MKAITTKYLPYTEHLPARIVASAEPHNVNRVVFSIARCKASEHPHRLAMLALCRKMGWGGKYAEASLDARRNVYAPLPDKWGLGYIVDAGEGA